MTLLQVSAKAYSNMLLQAAEPHDRMGDQTMMRFRKQIQCAELFSLLCLVVERSLQWHNLSFVAQLDIAWAYDSVHHAALWGAIMRRGEPEALAVSNIRKIRATPLQFRHVCGKLLRERFGEPA